jgi:hypothetical protein
MESIISPAMASIRRFCIPTPIPQFDPPLKLFGGGRSAFGPDFDLTAKSSIAQLVTASAAIADISTHDKACQH